ncbi:peptidase M15B and M15C DD-carboxypeptidase VanY/endolysin [Kribbella flavida DSM 17836]|uniref:Peptidase M15B and M15C DD-carboxypeptidase VanY/endolysin n=1 Tax=Kribbella flavida (strain DSM 17836 / JCM 10339 / NBRC 14399) TaxID=479435 RepID=D2PZY7_KRIFD|nr:M15 family metallopeptidase [Kribbella flavida]ADB29985.1 peptidase M15B and M15C DD-carboxypeptidase VanY/endolysin [Kribbella flavida DSM 17836]
MTNDVPPRRTFSVRARWLSVTGVVVAASLLVWHAQVADFLGLDTAGDKQPVVAGSGVPGGPTPPAADTPAAPPTRKASARPSPRATPTASPTRRSPKSSGPAYDEESVEGLSVKLRTRLLKAMAAAKADGVTLTITSGRRSAAKQRRLLEEAIVQYGSYQAATRWVLPPEDSAHVKGRAVDIGPQAGMAWLNRNGYRYGICRRYDNEPWHFEALTTPGRKCPPREPHSVATR